MPKKIKDIPLAEITLRKYEKLQSAKRRDLLKRFCLSIGLLQPKDSRDVIVDILDIIFSASYDKRFLTALDIEKKVRLQRKKLKLGDSGTASSNIRRQLKRLKDIMIIDRIAGRYRLNEFSSLKIIFEEKIVRYYLDSIKNRISELCSEIDGIGER